LRNRGNLDGLKIVDFGTRRRFNRLWQEWVLDTLKQEIPEYLAGTSNLHLARELTLAPVGTMAHEWFQAWQAATRLGMRSGPPWRAGLGNIAANWESP
jgi:nicotinate phosphoribosyltransferase